MNRAQRRKLGADKLSHVTVSFRNLHPVVSAPGRPVDSSVSYVGQDDDAIFGQVLAGLYKQMGVQHRELAAAMLFRAINANTDPEFRMLVAWGIANGLGYEVTHKTTEEDGETVLEIGVQGIRMFPPLTPEDKASKPGVARLVGPDGQPLVI